MAPAAPLHGLALVAGLAFAAWELMLIAAALWRVGRRHQVRHHYRVPVEVAGVVNGALVRVVDLTAGRRRGDRPRPIEVGTEVELRLDLPGVGGGVRAGQGALHRLLVPAGAEGPAGGWAARSRRSTEADGEALIEHCHVVSSRTRLTESGRLSPDPRGGGPDGPRGTGHHLAWPPTADPHGSSDRSPVGMRISTDLAQAK